MSYHGQGTVCTGYMYPGYVGVILQYMISASLIYCLWSLKSEGISPNPQCTQRCIHVPEIQSRAVMIIRGGTSL